MTFPLFLDQARRVSGLHAAGNVLPRRGHVEMEQDTYRIEKVAISGRANRRYLPSNERGR